MKNLIMDVGLLGALKMDMDNIYSDCNFDISIPFRYVDAEQQKIIYKMFDKIAIRNDWGSASYSASTASISISSSNSATGKLEMIYKLFVHAVPHNSNDEKPEDEPVEIRILNLSAVEKKIFKRILLDTIANQIMEMEE